MVCYIQHTAAYCIETVKRASPNILMECLLMSFFFNPVERNRYNITIHLSVSKRVQVYVKLFALLKLFFYMFSFGLGFF
jgi:hypothetical protein